MERRAKAKSLDTRQKEKREEERFKVTQSVLCSRAQKVVVGRERERLLRPTEKIPLKGTLGYNGR